MVKTILVIASIVILVIAAFGLITSTHVALLPLGLAVYISSKLVDNKIQ
jgi:hypothetical protein